MAEYILTINERHPEGRTLLKLLEQNRMIKVIPLTRARKKAMEEASINEGSLAKDWVSMEDAQWDESLK